MRSRTRLSRRVRSVMARLARGLAVPLVGMLLLGAGMLAFEHQFIYYPSREMVGTPADLGLAYEAVRFGEGEQLHGWFVPGDGPTTLLWLHGNAGNISHRLPWLASVRAGLPASIFIFDYQGYGLSRGQPSEAQTYDDARAALAYLRARPGLDAGRIVYLGKSLGGAVAAELATEHPPACLVLQSSFTSVADLARRYYPFIPSALIRTRYATVEKLGRLSGPVLIVHGTRDEIVPLEQAHRLYAAAAEPKRLLLIDGAGHNDVLPLGGQRYLDAIRECSRPG